MQVRIVRGWDPASPVYEVTRAQGSVLHEIDGEPAVRWFERFFRVGDGTAPMPGAAHHFPLIVEGPDPARQDVYRSLRAFDEPRGAVTLWGDVCTGDRIRIGIGNDVSLAEAARHRDPGPPPEAAVVYSCVGRELVLGEHAGDEVEAIHETLGGAPLAGFFTFGEIGPTPPGGLAFYNHTAVVALLRESGEGE
jgi:hypothetical protein